jgi:hypothetical protein
MKTRLVVASLLGLTFLMLLPNGGFVGFVSANPDGTFPQLSMPIEHVNYTITNINGSMWAKIDGNYPISILTEQGCVFSGDLPMVYPMPPGATNIHVWLGDRELPWSNYTQAYPEALHHTAIGDWGMIYCTLVNVSQSFLLKIHYEHPLQTFNGSYVFLYDLNISPYLSQQSSSSTCYYTIRMETNATNIRTFTTATDTQWNPISYTTTTEGTTKVISVEEHSVFGEPLSGDFVFEFSSDKQIPEISWLALLTLLFSVFTIAVAFKLKKRR